MQLNLKRIFCWSAILVMVAGVIEPQTALARHYRNRRVRRYASIISWQSLPHQRFNRHINGRVALYSLPGTVRGARNLLSRSGMKSLSRRKTRFMTYQKIITSRGSVYYKIVSLHHSVRGWVYAGSVERQHSTTSDASTMKQVQNRINQAEVAADYIKASGLVHAINQPDISKARRYLNGTQTLIKQLHSGRNRRRARAMINNANSYLNQVQRSALNDHDLKSIVEIKQQYNHAVNDLTTAQSAAKVGNATRAKRDIRYANDDLSKAYRILDQIQDAKVKAESQSLLNQALTYVDDNSNFIQNNYISANDNSGSLIPMTTNRENLKLIRSYNQDAANSIRNVYAHLNNIDETITYVYRAQNDVNRANTIVNSIHDVALTRQIRRENNRAQQQINNLIKF